MSSHTESASESENPRNSGGSKSGCCDGGEATVSLHVAVSSEGGGESTTGKTVTVVDQVAESFNGSEIGELESLPGFNPQRAINEGMPTQILTDELLDLGECRPEGFPPESVCGRDDRVQVTNTTAIPWRWICQLIIT